MSAGSSKAKGSVWSSAEKVSVQEKTSSLSDCKCLEREKKKIKG